MVLEDPVLGALRVRARLLLVASDSNDPGVELDRLPTLGTYEAKADYRGPKPLTHLATQVMVAPVTVTGAIRGDGRFLPPANGVALEDGEEQSTDLSPEIRLLAPKGNGLSNDGWTWTITAKPGKGQGWPQFSFSVTGEPSEVVVVGGPGQVGASEGYAQQITYSVATLADLPKSYRVGIDLALTPDGTIHASRSN